MNQRVWSRPRFARVAIVLVAVQAFAASAVAQRAPLLDWPSGKAKARFEITIPASVRSEATTGRAYVIMSRTNETEPRLQIGRVGAPMFARDFSSASANRPIIVDGTDLGTPVADMADVPAGEYWVQAIVNVYSRVQARRRTHRLDARRPVGRSARGIVRRETCTATPQKVRIDPRRPTVVRLAIDADNPADRVPADNEYVQRFKFQSPIAHEVLGAADLPRRDRAAAAGYATSTIRYPVNHQQGHFSTGAPYGFDRRHRISCMVVGGDDFRA